MAERIAFELNGQPRTVEVAPDTPLLYALRNELGLNNPHFGCGLAQCGACTVHVDGAIKFTIYRRMPSGSLGDADIFGSQQYGPLLDIEVPGMP
jgi:aerobic-type carbon monoxide dehydrogenase small subunit (CoxS/CutS family)